MTEKLLKITTEIEDIVTRWRRDRSTEYQYRAFLSEENKIILFVDGFEKNRLSSTQIKRVLEYKLSTYAYQVDIESRTEISETSQNLILKIHIRPEYRIGEE